MSHARHRFWKCYKTLTFCSLLTRCTIPCAKAHLNVQKCSEPLAFSTFRLGNVLRATTACTFSTSQLPKVLRAWCVLSCLLRNVLRATTARNFSSLIWPAGSAPAALASLLFDYSGATNHWKKHSVSRLSYLFGHLDHGSSFF